MSAILSKDSPLARTAMMARIIGVSAVHLGRLAKDEAIPGPVSRGTWNIVAVVQAYLAHERGRAAARGAAEGGVRSEELLLTAARRAKTEAEAEMAAIGLAERRGQLVEVEAVAVAWEGHIARARALLLAMPSRLALPLAGEADPQQIEAMVREEVHAALHELADEGQHDASEPADGESEDLAAAAAPEDEPVGG